MGMLLFPIAIVVFYWIGVLYPDKFWHIWRRVVVSCLVLILAGIFMTMAIEIVIEAATGIDLEAIRDETTPRKYQSVGPLAGYPFMALLAVLLAGAARRLFVALKRQVSYVVGEVKAMPVVKKLKANRFVVRCVYRLKYGWLDRGSIEKAE